MSQQEMARAGSRPDRSWLRRLRPERLWLSVFGVSLGLFLVRFLVPVPVGQADDRDGPRLMCGLAAVAIIALRLRRKAWHRDGAVVVLCMTGCAAVAFIPQAYFAGVGTTRHTVGTNLSTALAFVIGTALAVSMIDAAAARARRRAGTGAAAFPREPASQPQQAP